MAVMCMMYAWCALIWMSCDINVISCDIGVIWAWYPSDVHDIDVMWGNVVSKCFDVIYVSYGSDVIVICVMCDVRDVDVIFVWFECDVTQKWYNEIPVAVMCVMYASYGLIGVIFLWCWLYWRKIVWLNINVMWRDMTVIWEWCGCDMRGVDVIWCD